MNKIWLREEEQQEEAQRKKLEEQQEEEDDAKSKGIYSLVIKFDRDNSIEVLKSGSIEPPKGYYYDIKDHF